MTQDDVTRAWLLSDPLNFTRYFFKDQHHRKFIVGRHHQMICKALKRVLDGQTTKLIINIAPRYGKTELAVKNFIAMGLAVNPSACFIHLSYSENLALDSSEAVKDIVTSPEYQRLFNARIKPGHNSKAEWDTIQGGGLYATSTLGQITGFGAGIVQDDDIDPETAPESTQGDGDEGDTTQEENGARGRVFGGAIVIDDPIKPEDALSDLVRENVNRRFETTIRNRVNSRTTPIIIIMQRLHEHDLCGYLQEIEKGDWEVISLPCLDENGEPLWEFKHTKEELKKIAEANSFVFDTQYMQNPTPIEGLMYSGFKTYDIIPKARWERRCNYTDTADTGADFHCSICYVEHEEGNYITDILYTKKPMEYTEPKQAEMLTKNRTEICWVEANNGGRGFRRNCERECRLMGNTKTRFVDFTQTKNKQVRIFSSAPDVQNVTFFPHDWATRFPEFYRAVAKYRKEGGNEHDDAPDCLTGTFEKRGGQTIDKNAFRAFLTR